MEQYIYSIIYTFIYILLCKMFVGIFAKKREKVSMYVLSTILIVLVAFDYAASLLFVKYNAVKQIIVVLFGTVGMWFCFELTLLKSGLIVLLYQGLCFVTDYIAWVGLQRLLIIDIAKTTILELFMGILSEMIVFSFIIVLRRYFALDSAESLTNVEWARFSVFPIFTMVGIIAIVVNFDGLTSKRQINTLLYLAFAMLILNIFVFYLIRDAIKREVQIRKERLFLERAKSETAMYRQISENLDQQKKREHEYKNEMMVIATLLKQNELDKLNTYIAKYTDEIAHQLDSIDTNNVIVNAILNVKYEEARKKGILFVFKVNDLSGLEMEDQDIVVILSNMLNNAMEACEKCKGKRVVKVKAVKEKGKVIFSVINSIEEKPKMVNGRYITTKKERCSHGIGIENVKESVNKYSGNCAIRYDEKQFYFVVYLPNSGK